MSAHHELGYTAEWIKENCQSDLIWALWQAIFALGHLERHILEVGESQDLATERSALIQLINELTPPTQKFTTEEQAALFFGCDPSEIAWGKSSINEKTKAYVGPLFPGIFQELAHLERISTSFPESIILISSVTVGSKAPSEILDVLRQKNIHVSTHAKRLAGTGQSGSARSRGDRFKEQQHSERKRVETVVELSVRDLGFTYGPTSEELWGDPQKGTTGRIQKLGLGLCLTEMGPYYRLQHTDQPQGKHFVTRMKPVTTTNDQLMYRFERDEEGLWLYHDWELPNYTWFLDDRFLFTVNPTSRIQRK
jgi:hypothetical protein